jgi:hypothetical protein
VQFLAGAPAEEDHAAAIAKVERATQGVAGGGAAVGPAQRGAELDECACVFELGKGVRKHVHGVLEQGDRFVARERACERP